MNSKSTGTWLLLAAAMFVGVVLVDHFLHRAPAAPKPLLSDLRPAEVTSVQVIPAAAPEIQADCSNGVWNLVKPISYPAQSAAVGALLDALQRLKPASRINASELSHHADANAEFGFANPLSLVLRQGQDQWRVLVGRKTAPGDQVYLRVVGVEGVFVADANWLKFIPRTANDWRDTSLVETEARAFDWIVVTNNTRTTGNQPRVLELQRNPTNHLWRMIQPLPARANNDLINQALQNLQTARVTQFVTDDPGADLSAYGLQPASLDLWLGRGTNLVAGLRLGRSQTNDSSQIFAKCEDWKTIMTTARDPLSPWYGPVNDFRDPYLLDLTAPVAEISVRGARNFTLQRHGTNWQAAGETFPVDSGLVQQFIQALARLRISDFVKDVVTQPDLAAYGLTNPVREITLRSALGDTNAIIARLLFGATRTNEVFVRRADEDYVYAIASNDLSRLPEAGWQFRERRIWNFGDNDVKEITIHQNGKTRQLIRNSPNQWSLAPGSQGIINPPALEETAYRLGQMDAYGGWVAHDVTNAAPYGFKPDNLSITVALKDGKRCTVDFGGLLPPETVLASVALDGERWIFIFPPTLYQLVMSYLTIPANVP
ncbi:MAG: DUF4340 domain-containing protein [Verrucomicrobiota bacterium]|nr:DUF4340 domain-containing protein [Verrucomicrobiota bacterium]